MTRKERIEYLAKAVMTLSELGDNKTAYVLNEIRLELKQQPSLLPDVDEAAKEEYPDTGEASVDFKLIQRREDFKAGAEWQMKQVHDRCYQCEKNRDTVYWKGWNDCKAKMPMPEDTVIFQKGIEEGKRMMIEEAVEIEILTWEDMQRVWQIFGMMRDECKKGEPEWMFDRKSYFSEALKRFRKIKPDRFWK